MANKITFEGEEVQMWELDGVFFLSQHDAEEHNKKEGPTEPNGYPSFHPTPVKAYRIGTGEDAVYLIPTRKSGQTWRTKRLLGAELPKG